MNVSVKKRVALIAAKGSSERVKNKNIRQFHDTNLLELKISHLKSVAALDDIVVSSEDEAVLGIATCMGATIHQRDPHFSTSHVPMSEVYSYLASEMDAEIIVWTPVTNPLAGPDIYQKAIECYQTMPAEHDCLLSVYDMKEYLFYNGSPVNFQSKPWPRSQDLNGLLAMNLAVNILKRDDMIQWGSLVGSNPCFFPMDRLSSWDIDYQEDFDFCEMVYRQRKRVV